MSNETKRDVFGQLLNAYQNLIVKDIEMPDENYRENITTPWNIVYDAALPDDLPVIPKAVAAYIKKCKHDGIAIASAMDEDKFPKKVADYFRTYYTRDQWIELQDTLARAWLDGYEIEDKS